MDTTTDEPTVLDLATRPCHCLCARWGHETECGGLATTNLHFSWSVIGPRDVPMCEPCARDVVLHEPERASIVAASRTAGGASDG